MLTLLPADLVGLAARGLGLRSLLAEPRIPATPLGGVGTLPGGMAQIRGIILLETVGWTPERPATSLDTVPAPGGHLVRPLLDLIANGQPGIGFAATGYSVTDFAVLRTAPLWVSHATAELAPGDVLHATLVFELPDEGIELVLHGPKPLRLSLGTDHHR